MALKNLFFSVREYIFSLKIVPIIKRVKSVKKKKTLKYLCYIFHFSIFLIFFFAFILKFDDIFGFMLHVKFLGEKNY